MTLIAESSNASATLLAAEIELAASRIRAASTLHQPRQIAERLAQAFARWGNRDLPQRRDALARIAGLTGSSRELLDQSIDALIAPFTPSALDSFAGGVRARTRVGAFVMPANVPGAGMHELCAALIGGSGAIIKCSTREPFFFPAFTRTLADLDPALGSRVAVFGFGRDRSDLIAAMGRSCDYMVALGEDRTLDKIGAGTKLFGFGSRASGALVSAAQPLDVDAVAAALARDASLFEQQGCLSPHHVFVHSRERRDARMFAAALARALEALARRLPPATLSFHDAAALRRFRETARWRRIGGSSAELWEGAPMSWTVVFDPDARFTVGPGFRSLVVTPVSDRNDFMSRLAPVAGRLEAFALAAPAHERAHWVEPLARAGASYLCDPGRMQSAPITWPHGGGAFLDFIRGVQ